MPVVCTARRMRGYTFGDVVVDAAKAERLVTAYPRQFKRVPEEDAQSQVQDATEPNDDGAPASLPEAAAEKE